MVFYRKYRPQTIDELDSQKLRETLKSVFLGNIQKDTKGLYSFQNSLPHAFLFTGPKGLGKTSTARIIAKVINCTEIKIDENNIEICKNHCLQCISITNGSNLDVLEIDGASNRGIDEVRDLRDKVRLAPVAAHKKIYIIDEVHMLTTEAFNALLKTIEEPPEHVIFIFCTTEMQKVPQTIVSRCFNIFFTIATDEELIHSFERIIKSEHIKVDSGVLTMIAQLADGSFRDGVKILEELSLLNNSHITKEIVEQKFKVAGVPHFVSQMFTALISNDDKNALQIVSLLIEQGIDVMYFIQKLLEYLHAMLLKNVGIEQTQINIPSMLSLDDIKILAQLFSTAYANSKISPIKQLPLEIAIMEWVFLKNKKTETVELSAINNEVIVNKKEVISELKQKEKGREDLFEVRNELIKKIKIINQSLAGILRGCEINEYDGKSLILVTKFAFHKERLDDPKALDIVKNAAKEFAGNDVKVTVLLKDTI